MSKLLVLLLLVGCQSETPQAVQLQKPKASVNTDKYFQEKKEEGCELDQTEKLPEVEKASGAPKLQGGNTGCSVD